MRRRVNWIGVLSCACGFGTVAIAGLSSFANEEFAPTALSWIDHPHEVLPGPPTVVRSEAQKPDLAAESARPREVSSALAEKGQSTRLNFRQLLDLASEATGSPYVVASPEDARLLEQREVVLFGVDKLASEGWWPRLTDVFRSQKVAIVQIGDLESFHVYRVAVMRGEGHVRPRAHNCFWISLTDLDQWSSRPQSLLETFLPLSYVEPSLMLDAIEQLRTALEDHDALAVWVCERDPQAIRLQGRAHSLIAIHELVREFDIPPLEVPR